MVPDADSEVREPHVTGAARRTSPTGGRDAGGQDGAAGRPRPLPVPCQQFVGTERVAHGTVLPREVAGTNRAPRPLRRRRSICRPHLHLVG